MRHSSMCAWTLIVAVGLAAGCGSGYTNEPVNGVRGLSWGAFDSEDLERSRDLPAVSLEGSGMCSGCVTYEGPAEPAAFEGVAVGQELYVAKDGRLAAVVLFFDPDDGEALDAALASRFGSPTETTQEGPYTKTLWRGETVLIEIRRGGYIGDPVDGLFFEHLPTSVGG